MIIEFADGVDIEICVTKNNMFNRIKYTRIWRKKNPDKLRDYNKKWYKNNKKQHAKIVEKWRKNNPEKSASIRKRYQKKNLYKCSIINKRWRENHKIQMKKIRKNWQINNLDKYKEKIMRHILKRKRNLGFNLLNKKFKNSVGHHINSIDVIYMPEQLHLKNLHNHSTKKGMKSINLIALQYL